MNEQYRVSVPEGNYGLSMIKRFEITKAQADMANLNCRGRPVNPGVYTKLYVNTYLMMSDTDAEVRDHSEVLRRLSTNKDRVLIHGLGIGMVLQHAIKSGAASIDVVEINKDVIELVAPHYLEMAKVAGVPLEIHHADAMTYSWPPRMMWAIVWHDIWPTICDDNLVDMKKLHRKFGSRCIWQGSWCRSQCERMSKSSYW